MTILALQILALHMAKTPSDKLHRLIRSLTPAERRYFKIFIRGKTERDSKYLQLFEVLSRAEEYDSAKTQRAIYGKQVAESKKYPELKAYLFDLILKSLQSFDEQQSINGKLTHWLRSVAALFKRGHYEDCYTLLSKAQKTAAQYELFDHQLEVFKWQRHLAYTRMDVKFLHTQLDLLDYQEQQVINKLTNLAEYRKVFFRMYALIRKDAFQRDPNRKEILSQMLPTHLFDGPHRALSVRATIAYYRAINLYHYAVQDFDNFYKTGELTISTIENHSFFLEDGLSEYISALSNFILACGLKDRISGVKMALSKLRSLTPKTEDDRRKIHRQYYSSSFIMYQSTGEFETGYKVIAACKKEAEDLQSTAYETSSFYFQYFYISFGCGKYEDALHYLNEWMAQPRSVEREDLQSLARILGLILHYEMGNYLLLDSLIRSTTRFLKQKNRLYELEKRFIHLVGDLMKTPAPAEKAKYFQAFEQQWDEIAGAKAINQIFDLKSWVDCKLSGKTFGEVVRQKWSMVKHH